MNEKRKSLKCYGKALERGNFIRHCSDPAGLAFFPENGPLVAELFRQFRFEWVLGGDNKPTDEWRVIGRRGQLMEFGRGKLAVTVATGHMLGRLRRAGAWLNPHQIGDHEGTFVCDWTAQNVAQLAELVSLRRRIRLTEDQKVLAATRMAVVNRKMAAPDPQPPSAAEVNAARSGAGEGSGSPRP